MTEAEIPPLLATLFERLEGPEAFDLEFKSARGGLPKAAWETVSSFANMQGGWIVLGVTDGPDGYSIQGVSNGRAMLKQFHDQMRDQDKISAPVCGAADASVETLDGKEIVVIRVPAARRSARPIYIAGNPYRGTYVRRESGDYRCTKEEVDRMMRDASEFSAGSTVVRGCILNDLDADALAGYRRRHQTLHRASPWNGYDDQRFLEAIGAFRRDRETGEEGVTVAGLLMLGRPETIREWRPRHLIDYRRLPREEGGAPRWEDRVVWEGNLLGAFEAIYPRLTADEPVPFQLQLQLGVRVEAGPAQEALREALVNLLVHADYAESAASLVERAPDGFLFRNPGSSRVSEYDLLTGDRSDPRNPELVRMFRYIGLCEEAGTGVPKILSAWRELGFQMPGIDVGTERYEFSLHLRHVHLLSGDDRRWLSMVGEGWSEEEQLALVIARHEGEVTNLGLRTRTGKQTSDTSRVLGSLRNHGLLQMIGGKRGARYVLAVSVPTMLDSEGMEVSSEGIGASSEGTESPGRLHGPEWPTLLAISAAIRASLRSDPKTRDAAVLALCGATPLSLLDLAELLGRSPDYLRLVVRDLIRSGALSYIYPGAATHPHQKYVAQNATNDQR